MLHTKDACNDLPIATDLLINSLELVAAGCGKTVCLECKEVVWCCVAGWKTGASACATYASANPVADSITADVIYEAAAIVIIVVADFRSAGVDLIVVVVTIAIAWVV